MADCLSCGEALVARAEFCDYCGENVSGVVSLYGQADGDSSYRNPVPVSREKAFVSIGMGVVLTILTCGIYSLFWQARQFRVLNAWLGRREYSFWSWLGLSLITCGIYGIYSEYQMANSILEIQRKREWYTNPSLATLCVAVSVIGFPIASMAIQQEEINKFYNPPR